MLTGIGRAATQRVLIRTAFLAGPRTQPLVRVTCRSFSTSRWVCLPAAKASSTTTETKKALKAKAGAATKTKAPTKTKAKAAEKRPKEKKEANKKEELTPEQTLKLEIKEQKRFALLPNPKPLPNSTWTVYVTEKANDPGLANLDMLSRAKHNAEVYKTLSSSELQRLEEKAKENRLANVVAYKAWVESHTPIAVAEANRARAKIRKLTGRPVPNPIRDGRQPKRGLTAFQIFVKSRWESGDFLGAQPIVVGRQISEQWKALSESEREPFKQLAEADYERWTRDSLHSLGRVINKR
ncbi:hypothetical protein CTA2_8094 [Colletotrichum tanaceti]|uniref:HMG box domain-containing protein n=1 Tax=Colletotrichum tanaceti TaxID=1306861 RepID=A0A4U6XP61_9PEZI|nr:hypothetical protein CTA2_8094 [Colletotrichum tanaceti]TKW57538.1 hypothetical protein CTA1_3817 [Colletotrichum tanaceti]